MKILLKKYIELLRPFTLLAPLIVSTSIMIASFIYSARTDLDFFTVFWFIFPASLCFALLNGASNALNQATDYTEDKISKPYRPIPRGLVSQKQAYHVSLLLYILAISLSFAVHILFSCFILLISFFSITYSIPPRMKKMLFINQIWVAIPRGLCAILASWSVFSNPFQTLPLVIGGIATLFLIGGTATKDILDIDADRTVGTRTLVNVFGVKKTAFISLFFMISAFGSIILFTHFNIIDVHFLPLIALISLSFLIGWLMINSHKNKTYENTSAWSLMYGTYFLFSLGFSILTISYCL
jgi:4-hydroxybenzoate polyprenyltransferase